MVSKEERIVRNKKLISAIMAGLLLVGAVSTIAGCSGKTDKPDETAVQTDETKKMLLERLESCVRTDPVHTEVLDMTKLGLVEMTREKRTAPLAKKLAAAGL